MRRRNNGPSFTGGYSHSYGARRKDSAARIHSMTIEAPITKVINIINTVQESSNMTVAQSLDKVRNFVQQSFRRKHSETEFRKMSVLESLLFLSRFQTRSPTSSESSDWFAFSGP